MFMGSKMFICKRQNFVTFVTLLLALVIFLVKADTITSRVVHVCADRANVSAQCLVIGDANRPGDRFLVDESYEKFPIPLIVRTDDLVLPSGGESSNFIITFVQVSNPGDSGHVTLVSGDIGQRTVGLHLEAPRGHGYHFKVVIKGTPIVLSNVNSLNNPVSGLNPVLEVAGQTNSPSTY